MHVSHDAGYNVSFQNESLVRFSDRLQSCCVLLQVKRDEFWASLTHGLNDGVRFYAGHTRFATSSIVSPKTPIFFPLHTPS
jgi:hypothetical protein